jgi:hypothetical protein
VNTLSAISSWLWAGCSRFWLWAGCSRFWLWAGCSRPKVLLLGSGGGSAGLRAAGLRAAPASVGERGGAGGSAGFQCLASSLQAVTRLALGLRRLRAAASRGFSVLHQLLGGGYVSTHLASRSATHSARLPAPGQEERAYSRPTAATPPESTPPEDRPTAATPPYGSERRLAGPVGRRAQAAGRARAAATEPTAAQHPTKPEGLQEAEGPDKIEGPAVSSCEPPRQD